MNNLYKKTVFAVSVLAASVGAFAGASLENTTIASKSSQEFQLPKYWSYDVPDNKSYGILRKIVEVQGHEQLNIERWSPGNNDLTEAQINMLDFKKLDFSGFTHTVSSGGEDHLSDIDPKERIKQVAIQKRNWDSLVRESANPISNTLLTHDDINALTSKTGGAWFKNPTEENRVEFINALGMLMARKMDISAAEHRQRNLKASDENQPKLN